MNAPAQALDAGTAGAGPTAPAAHRAGSSRSATTRVTVLTGKRMTDLVLPASVPMESYLDDTVSALADLLEDAPADVLAGFDFSAQGVWAFARPGHPPLKPDQSLEDAGVVDGSLLTLLSVSRTERYRPVVEDVIDAIAVLDDSPQFDRGGLHRFIAVAIPVVTVALTVLAAFVWWDTGRSLAWPLAMGVLGVGVLAGSWVSVRFLANAAFAEMLLVAAIPLVATAVALAIPLPRGVASLGPPQLAGAAAAVLFLAMVTRGGPRRRIVLATFIAVTAIVVTAAAVCVGYGWQHWVPAGAIVVGLFVVTSAAKLTVAIARIALPPIPAPGEDVDRDELLDPVAGREPADNETPAWRAVIASVPDSADRFTERSALAKQLLIGFVTAGSVVLATGAIAVVVRGHFFVHSLVVAGLVTASCAFRSRLYAEPRCVWALLAAAVAIPTGVAGRLSFWYPAEAWLILSIYLGAVFVALTIIAATVGVRRLSPVSKRVIELIDGAVIAAIIPMLLWITGVYDLIRNLRF